MNLDKVTTAHQESIEAEISVLEPKSNSQESNSQELKQSELVIELEAEMELKKQTKVSDIGI